jgi:hypothetical protein
LAQKFLAKSIPSILSWFVFHFVPPRVRRRGSKFLNWILFQFLNARMRIPALQKAYIADQIRPAYLTG